MNPAQALTQLKASMEEHGLVGWTAGLDTAVRRFGICQIRKKHISLSRKLCELNSDEEVTDTILHEIAHALAFQRHRGNCGHDHRWKAICKEIGARPEACYDDTIVQPDAPWILIHKDTGEVFRSYYKMPRRKWSQVWIRGRKQETFGKLTVVPNNKNQAAVCASDSGNMTGNKMVSDTNDNAEILSFTPQSVLEVQENLVALVKQYAQTHGLQLTNAKCKYNTQVCDFTLSLAVPESQASADQERIEFEALAPLFDVSKDDYQRVFSLNGRQFKLTGFKPNNRKYPIIGMDENGRHYKFTTDVITPFLTIHR